MPNKKTTKNELRKIWMDEWPAVFARERIYDLTGGILRSRSLANVMCRGEGPDGAFYAGKKVMLRREQTIEWLLDRISEMPKK